MSKIPILVYILAQEKYHSNIQQCTKKFLYTRSNIKFKIFTNPFECAKQIFSFEADGTFIDDALFSTFFSALDLLKTKETSFTFKRFVVFSGHKLSENRKLELNLFGVRSVFDGIEHFTSALKTNIDQIVKYQLNRPKISLCLSGGGFDGYMYTLGVCLGLERCIQDFEVKDCDIFCGISSGSILSACFAGGIRTNELVQQAYKQHPQLLPLTNLVFFDFAFFDILKNLCQRKMPVGIFKGNKLKNFFSMQITRYGLEDSMEELNKNLYIFATDQDTGEMVVFGKDPWKKNIKISQAIRASVAIPPIYLPEPINGHWFTDGQLTTSTNFDLPIHEKSSLVFVIDPVVAFSTSQNGSVKNRGGYFILLQAIKNLVHSRSSVALQHARDKHPDVDFIKFVPTYDVMEAMAGNPMRFPIRSKLIESSARATMQQIVNQYDAFFHKFTKHGLKLKPRSEILQCY